MDGRQAENKLKRLVITVSVILSILRQIVRNLEPRSFALHEHMALGFYSRVSIKCSERETVDLGGCIEFGVEAGAAV